MGIVIIIDKLTKKENEKQQRRELYETVKI